MGTYRDILGDILTVITSSTSSTFASIFERTGHTRHFYTQTELDDLNFDVYRNVLVKANIPGNSSDDFAFEMPVSNLMSKQTRGNSSYKYRPNYIEYFIKNGPPTNVDTVKNLMQIISTNPFDCLMSLRFKGLTFYAGKGFLLDSNLDPLFFIMVTGIYKVKANTFCVDGVKVLGSLKLVDDFYKPLVKGLRCLGRKPASPLSHSFYLPFSKVECDISEPCSIEFSNKINYYIRKPLVYEPSDTLAETIQDKIYDAVS